MSGKQFIQMLHWHPPIVCMHIILIVYKHVEPWGQWAKVQYDVKKEEELPMPLNYNQTGLNPIGLFVFANSSLTLVHMKFPALLSFQLNGIGPCTVMPA